MKQTPGQHTVQQAAQAQYEPATAWLLEHAALIPPEVAEVLRLALTLGQQIRTLKEQQAGVFRQLLRALGVTPRLGARSRRAGVTR